MKRIVITILVAVGLTAGLGLVTPSANAATPRDTKCVDKNWEGDKQWEPAARPKSCKSWKSLSKKDWEPAHTYLPVAERELRYFEPLSKGRAYVEFNTGAAGVLKPCRLEDSERCFWDAGKRGNRKGRSFVRLWHHTFYL